MREKSVVVVIWLVDIVIIDGLLVYRYSFYFRY